MDADEDAVDRLIVGVIDVARWSVSRAISVRSAKMIQQPFSFRDERAKRWRF